MILLLGLFCQFYGHFFWDYFVSFIPSLKLQRNNKSKQKVAITPTNSKMTAHYGNDGKGLK